MAVENIMEIEMSNKKMMWFILNNKDPTWDILQKRTFVGPGWCNLCHKTEETYAHIILSCSFTKEVWMEMERMIGLQNVWLVEDVEMALASWYANKDTKNIRALPLNIAWGFWLARNLKLFEGKETLPLKCVVHALNILNAFPQP